MNFLNWWEKNIFIQIDLILRFRVLKSYCTVYFSIINRAICSHYAPHLSLLCCSMLIPHHVPPLFSALYWYNYEKGKAWLCRYNKTTEPTVSIAFTSGAVSGSVSLRCLTRNK